MKKKKILLTSIMVLMLVFLAGCSTQNKDEKSIKIGYFPNVSHAPAMIGIEQQLFSKELKGATIESNSFSDGSLFMDALLTGQVDIGYVGPGPVINRYLQGGDVVILSGASQGENVLVVRKDIEFSSLKDLEGKIVATPSTGCTHDLILRKMLQEEGLAVEENGGTVKRVAQKSSTMIGMFQQKQIDAAVVSEPWASLMEAEGVVNVVREADEVPWDGKLPATILVTTKEFLNANPELVEEVLNANNKAMEFINNNKSDVAKILSTHIEGITNEAIDESIILKSMDRITYTTGLDQSTMQEFADLSKELGFVEGESSLSGAYKK